MTFWTVLRERIHLTLVLGIFSLLWHRFNNIRFIISSQWIHSYYLNDNIILLVINFFLSFERIVFLKIVMEDLCCNPNKNNNNNNIIIIIIMIVLGQYINVLNYIILIILTFLFAFRSVPLWTVNYMVTSSNLFCIPTIQNSLVICPVPWTVSLSFFSSKFLYLAWHHSHSHTIFTSFLQSLIYSQHLIINTDNCICVNVVNKLYKYEVVLLNLLNLYLVFN